ncbi:MAG TPA: alpha/beta fold hydrolase, partial [Solirubrobacterales bacterium]|nr:alpha/beta fold hydrolase [Solirubrobacterales bacterium]
MVCLHGFVDSWRTWQLLLPELEREHDVLALTLAGHAGGPAIEGEVGETALVDAAEQGMDAAGIDRAHLVGCSLGGYIALQLAARGRAETVVALAPAGGWAPGDESFRDTLAFFRTMQDMLKAAVPYADTILASPEGRRRATEFATVNY